MSPSNLQTVENLQAELDRLNDQLNESRAETRKLEEKCRFYRAAIANARDCENQATQELSMGNCVYISSVIVSLNHIEAIRLD